MYFSLSSKLLVFFMFLMTTLLFQFQISAGVSEVNQDSTKPAIPRLSNKQIVRTISIIGNKAVQDEAILNQLKTQVEDIFDPQKIAQDIKRIFETGYFKTVVFSVPSYTEETVDLLITVVEKPSVKEISFRNFVVLSESSLKDKLATKKFTIADDRKLSEDLRMIEQAYAEKGYYLAKASYKLEPGSLEGTVDVVFYIVENLPVTIGRIQIIGNSFFNENELKSGFASKEYSPLSSFNSTGTFRDEFVTRDQQYMKYYYADNGFPEANITAPQSKLNSLRENISVSFFVEEGERFTVGKISIICEDIIFSQDELKNDMSLKEGAVYRVSLFGNDIKKLTNKYGDLGYAFAEVRPEQTLDRKNKTINLIYHIDKGEKAFFRKITIEGNTKTRDNVIRRALKIYEGQRYHATNMENSQQEILKTGYFADVSLNPDLDKDDKSVDVRIFVKEKSTGSLSASLGGSPDSSGKNISFFGQGQYREQNFIGKGYAINTSVQISPSQKIEDKEWNYKLGLDFSNPSINDSEWSFGVSSSFAYTVNLSDQYVKSSDEKNPTIYQKTLSGGITIGRELFTDVRLTLGYMASHSSTSPNNNLTSRFVESGNTEKLTQTLSLDKTDNYMMPTSGASAVITNTIATKVFFSEHQFGQVEANLSYFYPIVFMEQFKTNFRFSFQPGYVYSYDGSPVPIWSKYKLGNDYAMKGYKDNPISPSETVLLSPLTQMTSTYYTNGNRKIYGTIEYFVPLISDANLRLVTFLESGTVLDEDEHFNFQKLKYDIGFGLRWITPIAPFRFEWAWPIERWKLGSVQFIFSIGFDNTSY